MSNIQLYSNEEFKVRTTRDADGTVWFVAKDIAQALEYSEATVSNMDKTTAMIPECWKGRCPIPTPGGEQEMLCLTEQGVFAMSEGKCEPVADCFEKADARLIAAAPEIYKLLKSVANYKPDFVWDVVFHAQELLARIDGKEIAND